MFKFENWNRERQTALHNLERKVEKVQSCKNTSNEVVQNVGKQGRRRIPGLWRCPQEFTEDPVFEGDSMHAPHPPAQS